MRAGQAVAGRVDAPERGMLLMAGAMLLVPGMDALAKLLAAQLSPVQITFVRFAVQSGFLAVLLSVTAQLAVPRAALPRLALGGTLVAAAVSLLFWSLAFLPLANAIAIFFVEPLILTVFSALFLGERVGWHRIGAVLVGLVGALIVIRPNWAAFGWVAVLPLLAAVCYAGQLTVIRSISAHLGAVQVQGYTGLFAALFLGVVLLAGAVIGAGEGPTAWVAPDAPAWRMLFAVGLMSAVAHMMITFAFKSTPASILAPFQYLEIISATTLGFLVFGDFPDALTWSGTAIILGAGFYVFHRERRLSRAARPPRVR